MTLLPIVEREMRVAARRPATRWMRVAFVAAIMALWLVILGSARRQMSAGELSQHLFLAVGVLAMLFCLLAGVFLTADCVSAEKREGTIGLLFLTDLKSHDVVLGKLAATSLNASYGLVGIFPVLALPLLMGGVNPAEVGRLVALLLATLFFSLTLGLAVSVSSRDTRNAMTLTFLLLLLVTGVPPAAQWGLELAFDWRSSGSPLLWPSPGYAFFTVMDRAFTSGRSLAGYHASVTSIVFMGLGSLAWACLALPRTWQEKSALEPRKRESAVAPPRHAVDARARRKPVLEANPFFWLASRPGSLGWATGASVALVGLIWGSGFVGALASKRHSDEMFFVLCVFSAYALHVIFKYSLAVEATRRLSEDRQSGALELLLVTPLSQDWILRGHKRAMKKRFRWATVALTLMNLAMLWAVRKGNVVHGDTDERVFTVILLSGIGLLYLDLAAINWAGMRAALRWPRHHRAVLSTLGRVMLPPWLAVLLFIFLTTVSRQSEGEGTVYLWLMISFLNSFVTWAWARSDLPLRFRALATGTREAAPGMASVAPSPAGDPNATH